MGFFRVDLEGQSREELEAFVAKWKPIQVAWYRWAIVPFYLLARTGVHLPELLGPVMDTQAFRGGIFAIAFLIIYVSTGLGWAILVRERKIQDCWIPAVDFYKEMARFKGQWKTPLKVILACEIFIDMFFIAHLF